MNFKWINSIQKGLQKYNNKIEQLELSVFGESQKFIEVFEKNLALEQEIEERTAELNQANKSILTLKHIWQTMNSSEPLSDVLDTAIEGITEELGYLHCFIFQLYNNKTLRIRASAKNVLSAKLHQITAWPDDSLEIPIDEKNNIISKCINKKKFFTTNNFKDLIIGSSLELSEQKMEKVENLFKNRSISVLPIEAQDKKFGCLVVVSHRKEISDTEKNFLSLFAGQIELAVTIAGLFEQIREQAITDGLTSLYNRRYFDQCLEAEAKRSLRLGQPFTLIGLDMDHLKKINDTYGHSIGDEAICAMAAVLKENARIIDIPARFGGEEFGVILPGIDEEGGLIAAERIRSAIEAKNVSEIGHVTASVGVATFLRHTDDIGELFEIVDQAMYTAKKKGRNQVVIAEKHMSTNWQNQAIEAFEKIIDKQKQYIDRQIAPMIEQRIKDAQFKKGDMSELLYYIVDTLSKTYDPVYKRGYTKEKVEIASRMAEKIKLPYDEVDKIKMAVLLYDIGNIMMPEQILSKEGPLNAEERRKIGEHPLIAAKDILKPIKSAAPIIPLVVHHHEYWDGTGYPNNLQGNEIPIGSRILVIIDAYFAMISDRPYRKALSKEDAIKTLKEGANNKWDGKLVDIFISIISSESLTI